MEGAEGYLLAVPRRHPRLIAPALALVALLATACGGGDDGSEAGPSTTNGGATSTSVADDAAADDGSEPSDDSGDDAPDDSGSAAGVDVCAFLHPDEVTALVGGSWSADPTAPDACTYTGSGETLVLTLHPDGEAALDEVRGSSTGDRFVEDVDAFASGAVVAGDSSGATLEVWALVGASEAMSLVQASGTLDDDQLLAVFERAALAFENRPLPSAAGDDDAAGAGGEVVAVGDLSAVAFQIDVPTTGRSLDLRITVDDVVEAANPLTTQIYCIDLEAGGASGDIFAVLAMDQRITDGLRRAQLEATEAVDGPGTYDGVVELSEADGDRFAFAGSVTIDGTGDAGSFEMADDSGAEITGSWSCERG